MRELRVSLVLTALAAACLYAAIGVGFDYVLNIGIAHNPKGFTPDVTLAITILIGWPATLVLLVQRQKLAFLLDREKELSQRLEDALERAKIGVKAKDDFLANMSHEIRTPLNAIHGMTQVLQRTVRDLPTRQKLEVIATAGEDLLRLVDDVLDLSKIEAGALRLASRPFTLEAEIARLAEAFGPVAAAKGLVVETRVDASAAGGWRGDAARVRQILSILLSNALKFTPTGRVDLVADCDPAGALRLIVSDTGIGMTPAETAKIFDRFVQGDGSVTRRFGGAGLGLAICQELTDLMAGGLSVDSRPGEGSRFIVSLPLPRVQDGDDGEADVQGADATTRPWPRPKTATGGA